MSAPEYDSFYRKAQMHSAKQAIHHYVFLDLDAETCLRNANKRGRVGEDNLNLEYLHAVQDKHFVWRRDLKCFTALDMNGIRKNTQDYESVVDKIYDIATGIKRL